MELSGCPKEVNPAALKTLKEVKPGALWGAWRQLRRQKFRFESCQRLQRPRLANIDSKPFEEEICHIAANNYEEAQLLDVMLTALNGVKPRTLGCS